MSESSQLKWRCRRGVKELDVALCFYMDTHYKKASREEISTFKQLLNLEDPILYSMLLGDIKADDNKQKELLIKLRHCGSVNKFFTKSVPINS